MSSRRIAYLSLDVGSFQVVQPNGFGVTADNFALKAGDSAGVILRLTFVTTKADGTTEPFVFAVGAVPKLLAKVAGDYDGDSLILSESARWDVTEDWPDRDGDAGEHSVRVVTNTVAALAYFSGANADSPSVSIGLEVELNTPGEGISTIAEWNVALRNQYSRGDEGDPEEADPLYATEDFVTNAIAAALNARIDSGIVLTKESGTMKVTVDGAPRGNI